MRSYSSRDVMKILLEDGWVEIITNSSIRPRKERLHSDIRSKTLVFVI